jgi:hypothetical protein
MEIRHSNTRLPLHGKGDVLDFVAKRRRIPNNECLPLLA